MAPAMTSADLYEGWAYNNGAFALAFNASWATFLADDVARRRDPDLEPTLAAMYAKVNDYYWWLPLSAIPNLTRIFMVETSDRAEWPGRVGPQAVDLLPRQ